MLDYGTPVERRSYSYRVVFAALVLSLALAFVLAIYIHNRFASYRPKATYHLPKRVSTAVWLNVEQNVGFDVFKDSLLPLLEVGRSGPEPRVKHLERKTTLELEVDTREFVFAELDQHKWLILLGGLYRRENVEEGLLRLLSEEGIEARLSGGLVVTPHGSFGIAPDGVLVASNSEAAARGALAADTPSDFQVLLHKPGTVFNLISYDVAAQFAEKAIFSSGADRIWWSLEPGNPFPLFVERLGAEGSDLAASDLPFDVRELQRLSSPSKIQHYSGQVPPEAFRRTLALWARDLKELIWENAHPEPR